MDWCLITGGVHLHPPSSTFLHRNWFYVLAWWALRAWKNPNPAPPLPPPHSPCFLSHSTMVGVIISVWGAPFSRGSSVVLEGGTCMYCAEYHAWNNGRIVGSSCWLGLESDWSLTFLDLQPWLDLKKNELWLNWPETRLDCSKFDLAALKDNVCCWV